MQFSVVLGSLIPFIAFVSAASPPACILNAIGVQGSDANDMTVLCDSKQEYVLGNMTLSCTGDNLQAAYDHYSSTCLEKASITVSALPSESTDEASQNGGSSNNDISEESDKENAATAGFNPSLTLAVSSLVVAGITSLLL